MAIYHCSIKIISRGKGKSAVAAAAYRAGEKIINDYDGQLHDFTRKGGIVHTEILLSANAPSEYENRAVLWNAVEKIEKAKNSQLAREIELALPIELSLDKNIKLVREYCRKNFVSVGMCSDICIHDKQDGNPHAHIMLTMRPLELDGSWGTRQKKEYILDENGNKIYDKKKRQYKCNTIQTTDWNEQTKVEEWRSSWADIVNQFLTNENIAEQVDHRSFERQGIELIPTVHMGVAASQMERRGIITDLGERNREINDINKELKQIRARINKLKKWLEEAAHDETPNLQNIIGEILSGNENKTQWQKIFDLKKAAAIRNFLVTNDITTLPQLQDKVMEMRNRRNDISDKMKANERRQKTLTEHIKQAEYYLQFREIYKQYKQQKPNKQETFKENHSREIILFETAEVYLKRHMNGHKTLPIKTWKLEASKLKTEKNILYQQFTLLREEVREVEIIQRNVEQLMVDSEQERKIVKDKAMER